MKLSSFLAVGASLFVAPLAGAQVTVYKSIPNPVPGNVVSQGYECCSTAELGDEVKLAGTARVAGTVTVLMSSWAKHSDYPSLPASGFTHPITLTIYAASSDGLPGAVIAQRTQNVHIPFRPEADPTCPGGTAWRAADGSCFNGLASTIVFDMANTGVGGSPAILPNTVVVGIAYNTRTHGYAPLGVSGPYDSLNVGLNTDPVPVSVGTDVDPDAVFWNTTIASWYTDGGVGGVGTFRKDTNWTGYVPTFSISAYEFAKSKDQCKNDGWKTVYRTNGTGFKNQGDCVSYTNNGK